MASSRGKFVITKGNSGRYYWELVVRGSVIARSKSYPTRAHAKRSIPSLLNYINSPVKDAE